jgi:hypothetical protein
MASATRYCQLSRLSRAARTEAWVEARSAISVSDLGAGVTRSGRRLSRRVISSVPIPRITDARVTVIGADPEWSEG